MSARMQADVEKIAAELRALVDPMAEAMPDGVRLTGLIQVGRALLDELDRLREANRKLHRRVQVAERFQDAVAGQANDLWRFYKSICPDKDMEYWAGVMHRAVLHRLTVSRAEVRALSTQVEERE